MAEMTVKEFLKLSADEQNAIVAEHVIGWTVKAVEYTTEVLVWPGPDAKTYVSRGDKVAVHASGVVLTVPPYVSNDSATWQVVYRVNEEHGLEFTYNRVCEKGRPHFAQFEWKGAGAPEKYSAVAESAPLAICIAALKAIGFLCEEG